MADIRVKLGPDGEPKAWLVRWRDGGKQRYRQFRSEAEAAAFKKTVEPSPVDRIVADAKRRGEYRDVFGDVDRFGNAPGEAQDAEWSVASYARRVAAADPDLADSTRFTYERTIRLYLDGT
ncbi:MAG: hypothetical protein ACXWX6_06230, partial [Actinomycetota bacterium]